MPATPGGELAKELRAIVEKESVSDMKCKIAEPERRTVKSKLQNSNPTATPGCDNADCLACARGCHGCGVGQKNPFLTLL